MSIIQALGFFCGHGSGNFIARMLGAGKIKEANVDKEVKDLTEKTYKEVGEHFEKGEIRSATSKIVEYIMFANKYYDSKEPWIKAKEDIEEFNNITYTCTYIIANISNLIQPILPKASIKIKEMLNLPEATWNPIELSGDYEINNLNIIYERIEDNN